MDKASIVRQTGYNTAFKAAAAENWLKGVGLAWVFVVATAASFAQEGQASPDAVAFKSLFSFAGADGGSPVTAMVQATDGNLYGITSGGGAHGSGVVYKTTPNGSVTLLHSFCAMRNCADGSNPTWLALGSDGSLYGTTASGGASTSSLGGGTFFNITSSGVLTTLYNFCTLPNCVDGYFPLGIVQGHDGNFYGTAGGGGNATLYGTVFKVTPQGTLTTLYDFCSLPNCADGADPAAPVIQGADGNLYGTAQFGGANNLGTVYTLTPKGVLTTLHSFDGSDGEIPLSMLLQGADGKFYGAADGGANNASTIFSITTAGVFKTVYDFCSQPNCKDGSQVIMPGGLIQGTDGGFYGATVDGGAYDTCMLVTTGCGTVFRLTSAGVLTTLHSFDGTDGEFIFGGLMQSTYGVFYGTAEAGGTSNVGTIFALSEDLPPFVETVPESGKVGVTVHILGNNLASATGVTFNGVAAAFTVASKTLILATVPVGAASGEVEVVTPTSVLKSNSRFVVR